MAFHNAQTPEDLGDTEKSLPVIYHVVRETGDHWVGPMEYNYAAGASDFYLCASCGLKDKDAERLGDGEAAYALEMGYADICADCEDEF